MLVPEILTMSVSSQSTEISSAHLLQSKSASGELHDIEPIASMFAHIMSSLEISAPLADHDDRNALYAL